VKVSQVAQHRNRTSRPPLHLALGHLFFEGDGGVMRTVERRGIGWDILPNKSALAVDDEKRVRVLAR
jgi:hypothetical protein